MLVPPLVNQLPLIFSPGDARLRLVRALPSPHKAVALTVPLTVNYNRIRAFNGVNALEVPDPTDPPLQLLAVMAILAAAVIHSSLLMR